MAQLFKKETGIHLYKDNEVMDIMDSIKEKWDEIKDTIRKEYELTDVPMILGSNLSVFMK